MYGSIEPFLRAEITSEEQQSVAKSLLCDAFGLVTQKGDANSQARLEEGVKFQMDVEVSSRRHSRDRWLLVNQLAKHYVLHSIFESEDY